MKTVPWAGRSGLEPPESRSAPRPLIIHYHLFKNAGSSVDAILQANFAGRCRSAEFPPRPALQERQLRDMVAMDREFVAISSHTLTLPPCTIGDVLSFPIVFLRHPLDRQKSAYNFERVQQADTRGARLAKEFDFAAYLEARLTDPKDPACRDFQTRRLALMDVQNEGPEFERALRVVESFPFIGLVEAFAQSIAALEQSIRPLFPSFRGFVVHENASHPPDQSLGQRLALIAAELGPVLSRAFEEANPGDFDLYRRISLRYAAKSDSAP
jgi:hypothetical protein